jgi:hypothetical protein
MNKQTGIVILLMLVALLFSYGCATGPLTSGTLSPVAIPPTPTASIAGRDVPKDSQPAFALVRQAQTAMQHVSSYYFKQDNSTDTHLSETIKDVGVPGYIMRLEGQAMPPIARYQQRKGTNQFEYVVVGKSTYFMWPGSNDYTHMSDRQTDYNPFVVTGALNNPLEYINFTLDTAKCATIIGNEKVAGADTTRLRFILPIDAIGMQGQGGPYARDIWIDKDTHYLRQLQIIEIFDPASTCEETLTIYPTMVRYTSAILLYLKHNEPITPPIEAPSERVPVKP